MLISGNTEVRKLFKGAKTTDRFTTELVSGGAIRITKVNTKMLRANASKAAFEYVNRVEKRLTKAGYDVQFTKLSISQFVCLILKNNKLIYSGFAKCNMEKDKPDADIGEALALWRAVSGTPSDLPEAVWNYVFNS